MASVPETTAPAPSAPGHDIVVLGASAGGVEALREIAAGLARDLPASVFVALHTWPAARSMLDESLSAAGPLHATFALHGEDIERSHIYLAPPDNHLIVRPGLVHVVRGPKENGHRPAVDVLFRSAAAAYGPRVLGVVLTGFLECGTAGLISIKARGGVTAAQDPADAAAPSMPRSAIAHAEVDAVVPLRELPAFVERIVRDPAGPWPPTLPPAVARIEGLQPSGAAELVCPTCQGKVTVADVNGFPVFRCHVGHAFSLESLVDEQADEVERALWASVRALEESAALSDRLARASAGEMRSRFEEKRRTQLQNAKLVRRLLIGSAVAAAEGAEPPPSGEH